MSGRSVNLTTLFLGRRPDMTLDVYRGRKTIQQQQHKTIYSDRFIWYEKAFLTCLMDLVSD